MAISVYQANDIPPTLLHVWRTVMHEDVWHFNQVSGPEAPLNDVDPEVIVQWQRELINEALVESYGRLMDKNLLGFPLMPQWFTEDIPLSDNWAYQLQQLTTKRGYIQAFGQRATTLIEAAASITYTASSGKTYDDIATITVTDATATADEIQVFFQAADQRADGNGTAGDQRYQIVPLTVTKSGSTITITGHRALFTKPSTIWDVKYTGTNYNTIVKGSPATAGDFVTAVDVYRVYNDTTTPVQLLSDPIFNQDTDLDVSLTETAVARLLDSRIGMFQVRRESAHLYRPAIARVYYKAGYPLVNNDMDMRLARALVRYANTLMPHEPYNANFVGNARWAGDREVVDTNVIQAVVSNPLGMSNGALAAWRVVQDMRLGQGGKITHRNRL